MPDIYGVNPDKEKVTPEKIRDAMVECFYRAHCHDADLVDEIDINEKSNRVYCKSIVKKAFADGGGDFERPTRQGIMGAVKELKKFAANFRDPSIIKKHAGEIMILVDKMSNK